MRTYYLEKYSSIAKFVIFFKQKILKVFGATVSCGSRLLFTIHLGTRDSRRASFQER